MMRRARAGLLYVLLAGSVSASALEPTRAVTPPHTQSIHAGVQAPEAAGVLISGQAPASVSALRGRVLIVEFWASWCGPCVQSMPRLDALRGELRQAGYGERFEVLGVGLDDTLDAARRFIKVHPVTFPVVVDTLGIASRQYGVWRLPATFLIDRDGTIEQIYHGYGEGFGDDLRQRALSLLQTPAESVGAAR